MTLKWKRANKEKQQTSGNSDLIRTNARGFWLVKRTLGWKNFIPENFLEINRYFALRSYCNTIGQSNYAFSILGFLWRENEEAMFWSFHPLADKTNNEHVPRSRSYENHSNVKSTCASGTKEETRERTSPLVCAACFTRPLMDSLFAGWRNIWIRLCFKSVTNFQFYFKTLQKKTLESKKNRTITA